MTHLVARDAELTEKGPWVITKDDDDIVIGGPVITFVVGES